MNQPEPNDQTLSDDPLPYGRRLGCPTIRPSSLLFQGKANGLSLPYDC